MREELSYQIINNSSVNQAVFCFYRKENSADGNKQGRDTFFN